MKTELYLAVAVLLYIVFLSHSPPRVLRDLLSNEYIAFVVFVLCAYVTLWRSRTVGVLLILAFILTMTRVTEHLDVPPPDTDKPVEPSPPNTPPPPSPPVPSTTPTIDTKTVPRMSTSSTTPVTVSATTAPSPAQPPPPITTTPPPPTAPATPPVPTAPPAPVMSCNIESFASF
jgi:hypothetical protein